jgi:hypothetical protein
MKKFYPFIVVILLLAGAAAWFFVNRTHGTFDKEEDAFAVSNKKDITKVILADTDKKRVELTLVNGVWMVNGKYPAREELIISLFDVITRIKTLCPVPRAAHDYVVRSLFEKNTKVEVYTGKNEQPVKVYYVGGQTPDGNGTYMLREVEGKPENRPYITYLPGLQAYLTPRFQTDEEVWRDRVMFKYEPEDIKSLSLEYPAEENKSFAINRVSKDSFSLSAISDKYTINQAYQQKYVREYLKFYSSISIETFDNKNPEKDSVVHTTTPYCIFTITGNDGKVNKARLFYQPINKRSKMPFDNTGKIMTYDVDHYYAAIHDDKDFAVVQYYVFGKLLRSYPDFFFKPGK